MQSSSAKLNLLENLRNDPSSPSARRRPRIGIYLPQFRPSGPKRYVDAVIRAIDPAEHELVLVSDDGVVAFEHLESHLEQSPLLSGAVPFQGAIPVSKSRPGRASAIYRACVPKALKRLAGFFSTARRLAQVFRAADLDLLHTQNTGCEESAVAARIAGVPRVLGTFHVDSTYDVAGVRKGPSYRLMEFLSNHSLHHAIAVSEATKVDWVRRTALPRSRVTTIHNGIDTDHFQRHGSVGESRVTLHLPPAPAKIIAAVGRLSPEKGTSFLLDAFAGLASRHPTAVLAIAGTGPSRDDLVNLAERLGIADRVVWLGFLSDVRPLLEAADIFVMPSLCETIGYAHMEAAAMEVPVVATRAGGIPEVVVDGETGLLVKPGDATALLRALGTLLESPEVCLRYGRVGRRRIELSFREEDMARKTIDVYRAMLGTLSSPRPQ